ncbi:MAG: lactonase family protein [Chitinophagaceae bacterium]|nr:lactonase family protein [Chitinophagaceae bacterium]
MKHLIAAAILMSTTLQGFSQAKQYLLIGTYTSGKGEGIYVYSFDKGKLEPVSKVVTNNPSYLAVSPDQRFVYAVHEESKANPNISSYAFDNQTGSLRLLNQQNTNGDHPCYVAVDNTGKWVAAANYSGGNFSVFPVNADGSLQPASQTIQHEGKGKDPKRQSKPYVHSTVFAPDNKHLFVQDLGQDKIFNYNFNEKTGEASPAADPYTATAAGGGPRHLDFHPSMRYAYLMEEMSGNVIALRYNNGILDTFQTISAIEKGYTADIGSADIHVSADGKFLYASNRGQSNDIAVFRIDQKSGKLTHLTNTKLKGQGPRNFTIDPTGKFLLVANQRTDNIEVYLRNPKTGLLTPTGTEISVGNPVCLKWIR